MPWPGLDLYSLRKSAVANPELTEEEFEVGIATPNYRILGRLAHGLGTFLDSDGGWMTVLQEGLGTNTRIYFNPNVMKDILRLDPYSPESRPVVLIDSKKLEIDAAD